MNLYAINTGNLKLSGRAMFGGAPKAVWSHLYPCDEHGLCNWSMRCLLLVDGDRKLLIDCGAGTKQSEEFFSGYHLNGDDSLEKSLNHAGFSFEDITDVIISHFHFDHAGGAIIWNPDRTGYLPAFSNATYWTSRRQWELAVNPGKYEKSSFQEENILPLKEKGKLQLIDTEREIFPGVSVRIFDGHTNGQIIPLIKYKEKVVVFTADVLPSAAHISLPHVMIYDTQPSQSLEEKENLLIEAAARGYILFFEHDLYRECCTLVKTEEGIRMKDVFTLAEI